MLATKEKFKSNMKINKTFDSNGFTQVSNNIVNDSRLDLKEKGLMLHILSKPDGWFLNVDEICKNNRDGKKAVYSGIKKLKELGYIKLKSIQDEKGKIIRWEYTINLTPTFSIVDPLTQKGQVEKGQVEKGQVENRSYNNTNINNTNINNTDYYYKDNNFEDDINNVENCIIQIADLKKEKEDLDKIQIIRNYLSNITSPDLPFKLKDVESLQRQAKDFYYGGMPIDDIKTMIDLFPDFVKANKNNNPKKSFSEYQSLSLLADALKKNYNYPEWFNNFQKNKVIETKKDEWKEFIKIWDKFSVASTQRDSLNLIISHFMIFIMESKRPESKYYNGLKDYTEDSLRKSLKIKSIDEIMLMIDSQIKEQNGASTTFKKDTKDFFLNGFTIDSIKDLFKSIEV